MSRKILFLDIDGVLNRYYDPTEPRVADLNPEKVRLLEVLIKVIDCDIALTTCWIKSKLIDALSQNNFKYLDRITGAVPRIIEGRGAQIAKYIKDNNVIDFLVIDDECDDILGDHECVTNEIRTLLDSKFYQVNMKEGITKNDVRILILMDHNIAKKSYTVSHPKHPSQFFIFPTKHEAESFSRSTPFRTFLGLGPKVFGTLQTHWAFHYSTVLETRTFNKLFEELKLN